MIRFPGLDELWAVLPEARLVGGAVRDFLAGGEIADVDLASPLAPEAVMARLAAAGIKAVPTGLAHGTVTAVLGAQGFEITTLRRDVATDGRHAIVAFTDDWREDAARRDFTINAMSMTRDGEIFDYFGGRRDLAQGIVRFVGAARLRIAEDYLRILRFFRFFARYATAPLAEPDPEAVAAIAAGRAGILTLSAERVWRELKLILQAPDPRAAVALMRETGVLALTMPEGFDIAALNRLVALGGPREAMTRLAALLAGDAEALAARLRLSHEELAFLTDARKPNQLTPAAADADIRRALADTNPHILITRTWLAQDTTPNWDELRERIAATRPPTFPLRGRDLAALNIPPGPQIGEILATTRTWWLQTGCTATRAACLDHAKLRVIAMAGGADGKQARPGGSAPWTPAKG